MSIRYIRPRLIHFALLFALLASSATLAHAEAQLADLVVLNDGQDKYSLGRHLEILRDPSGELTLQDVTSPAYQDQFILSQVDRPNFGYQSAVYWVRFRVINQSKQTNRWVLELDWPNMHYMDLYLPSTGGNNYQVRQSGVLRSYESRDFPFNDLAFNLDLLQGNEQTIYLRFQNEASMSLPLILWKPKAFNQHMFIEDLKLGAFYGILLLMALYNSFLYLLIKDRAYLYLILVIAVMGVFYLFYDGLVFQFITIQSTRWATSMLLIFMSIAFFSIVKFTDSLLDLKKRSPKIHLIANFLAGIWILISLGAVFMQYRPVVITITSMMIITASLILVLGLRSWRAGYRQARYLFISWIWFLTGLILAASVRLGILPSTNFTEELVRFGLVWMVAVWSLALADRVKTFQASTEAANLNLQESENRYRTLVEIMNEGLSVADENERFSYVNPRLVEMLGYSMDEMIGHPLIEFFDEENREIIKDQLARRRLGEEQPYTLIWRRKDDSELYTQIAPAAVFSESGEFQQAIAVVTDISEQVKASQLLEQRVTERTHELSTLLEVSQVVVGTLDLEPLLKVILEVLQSVIEFDGAAIFSLEDRTLTTLNFPVKIKDVNTTHFIQSISASLHTSERVGRDEAIIIADIQADTQEGRNFRAIISTLIDVASAEMRAWMGIPLKVKDKLVGILSVHHHQVSYYTPAMAQLAHAFANQAAVAIENARLYRQAQAAAASEERSRLARELHDSVTQALYSLTLYAEATRLALRTSKTEAAEKNLREVLAIAREGMGDLRLLIFELRPPVLEEEGLVGALQARLEAVESRAGCQAEFHVSGEPNLAPEVETELYWTVHEALNNVLKHAQAKHVIVDLEFHDRSSKITIRDDGVGFDSSNIKRISGIGLKNITERIERIGGSFKIESNQGQGTLFEVALVAHK